MYINNVDYIAQICDVSDDRNNSSRPISDGRDTIKEYCVFIAGILDYSTPKEVHLHSVKNSFAQKMLHCVVCPKPKNGDTCGMLPSKETTGNTTPEIGLRTALVTRG